MSTLPFFVIFALTITKLSPGCGTPVPSTLGSIKPPPRLLETKEIAMALNSTDLVLIRSMVRSTGITKNSTNSDVTQIRSIGGADVEKFPSNNAATKSLICEHVYDKHKDCNIYKECCRLVCNAEHKQYLKSSCGEKKVTLSCECLPPDGAGSPFEPQDSTADPQETSTDPPKTPSPQSTPSSKVTCGKPTVQLAEDRIIGGSEAYPHSWPWQVSLRCKLFDGMCMSSMPEAQWDHQCGGTVLDEYHILTAAHCFYKAKNSDQVLDKREFQVILGLHERQSINGVSRDVSQFWIHDLYNHSSHSHDVAIIRLSQPIIFSDHIMPVCLPEANVHDGTNCFATGWGRTIPVEGAPLADELRQVEVPIVSRSECNKIEAYSDEIDFSMICAGSSGKDSCAGDSGGPLVCQNANGAWEQQGITSWGKGCGQSIGGVYTKVTKVLDWIKPMMEL